MGGSLARGAKARQAGRDGGVLRWARLGGMLSGMPMPLEIIGLNRPQVTFVWEDGHSSVFEARELRLRCRCAMCIEEMTGAKLLDPSQVPEGVMARGMELVGQYAVSIQWSDGHGSGIFNFRDLRQGCPCEECSSKSA